MASKLLPIKRTSFEIKNNWTFYCKRSTFKWHTYYRETTKCIGENQCKAFGAIQQELRWMNLLYALGKENYQMKAVSLARMKCVLSIWLPSVEISTKCECEFYVSRKGIF